VTTCILVRSYRLLVGICCLNLQLIRYFQTHFYIKLQGTIFQLNIIFISRESYMKHRPEISEWISRQFLYLEARYRSSVIACGICGGYTSTLIGFTSSISVFPIRFIYQWPTLETVHKKSTP